MEGAFEAMGVGEVDYNWRRSITAFGSRSRSRKPDRSREDLPAATPAE